MRKFHDQGVRTVIFSSTELNSEFLVALASSRGPEGEDSTAYEINIPKFPAAFVGTGKNVSEVAKCVISRLIWIFLHVR